MNIKSLICSVCTYLAVVSFNANAAYFPATVESTTTGSIDVLDPSGVSFGAVPVNFNSILGDFDFTYLVEVGVGYNSTFYTSPGTYTFDSTPDALFPSVPISMTIGNDQLGMRTFIDWNSNIYDILMVWDVTTSGNLTTYTAIDVDGDGIRGYNMVSGPFAGLNVTMDVAVATPIPAAVWLFSSGLLGLIGMARRKKA